MAVVQETVVLLDAVIDWRSRALKSVRYRLHDAPLINDCMRRVAVTTRHTIATLSGTINTRPIAAYVHILNIRIMQVI